LQTPIFLADRSSTRWGFVIIRGRAKSSLNQSAARSFGAYFDWRLFAFLLNAIVIMLLVHVRARRARARLDGIER
jgi:hypothetical protein